MSAEWPLPRPPADAEQPFLPLALHEHVEMILGGPAVTAFAECRAEQMLRFGHSRENDLALPVDHLVREAGDRLISFTEITGRQCERLPPARRAMLIRKVEIAGALLIAAHDRLLADPIEDEDPIQ